MERLEHNLNAGAIGTLLGAVVFMLLVSWTHSIAKSDGLHKTLLSFPWGEKYTSGQILVLVSGLATFVFGLFHVIKFNNPPETNSAIFFCIGIIAGYTLKVLALVQEPKR